MVNIYGIYQEDCQDGCFSAIVLKMAIPNIILRPLRYEEFDNFPISFKKEDIIYFADICPKPEFLFDLEMKNIKWTVIDHHVGACNSITEFKKKNPECLFENYFYYPNKCGATACWDFFFKNKKIPEILKFVEITDTWKWNEDKNSKFVALYMVAMCEGGNFNDFFGI